MNSIDIGILVIMAISCLMGFWRGFTREVLGLFTWLGSVSATYLSLPLFGKLARDYISNPMIADAVTAVILFIIFLIIFSIISGALSNTVKSSSLGGVDHALGFSFGILRGVIVICGIEIIISTFTLRHNQSEAIQNSRFITMVRHGSDNLIHFLPKNIKEFISHQQTESLSKTTSSQAQPSQADNLTGIVTDTLKEAVVENLKNPEAMKKLLLPSEVQGNSPSSNNSQQQPSFPPLLAPQKEEDRDKTAESLSKLTPQAMIKKEADGNYDKRQQRSLDRLVELNQ